MRIEKKGDQLNNEFNDCKNCIIWPDVQSLIDTIEDLQKKLSITREELEITKAKLDERTRDT